MGWLGWTEQETLDTSMPAIVTAYQGRVKMLEYTSVVPPTGRGAAPAAEPAPSKPVAPDVVRSTFRALASRKH